MITQLEHNSSTASARRTRDHSVAPYLNFNTSTQHSRHTRQCDTHLCIRTALELPRHARSGSQSNPNRSAHACPGSGEREISCAFTNQRTRNGIKKTEPSIDFNYQPRDLEMRNNFAAERNPISRTYTLKSQATVIQNTTRRCAPLLILYNIKIYTLWKKKPSS